MQASRVAMLRGVRFDTVGITQITVSAGTLTGEYVDRVAGVASDTEQLRVYVVRSGEATAIGPARDEYLLQSGHALIGLNARGELRIDSACELLVIDAPRELVTQALKSEVRRARVEAAAEMLQDQSYAALGVDQVAKYVGFSAGSSLARAMAAEGFPTPSSLRKVAA